MLRSFESSDCSLPESLIARDPSLRESLRRLDDLELTIQDSSMRCQRMALAASIQPEVHQKVLRIFLRHQLLPATQSEPAHFLIRVEGEVLDPKYKAAPSTAFTNFFDRIKVIVDRRYYAQYSHLEWDAAAAAVFAPQEAHKPSPSCVQFKLFGDKPSM